jgi:hypothetical protein
MVVPMTGEIVDGTARHHGPAAQGTASTMEDPDRATVRVSLRIGAFGAVAGAIVSVAAGIGFGNLTNELDTEQALRIISARPGWYWPTVHLGFIVGAFLWVGAFAAFAASFAGGASRALGRLAFAIIVVGAAIHVVDSSISGFGLAALASAWASAPPSERAHLLRVGDALLYILHGTWPNVHSFFHGLPFVVAGAAVALSRRYPAWIGWVGAAGGAASLLGGVLQFLGAIPREVRFVIVPAQVVSLWFVAVGLLMWRRAREG